MYSTVSIVVCLVHARNRTFKVKSWSSIKLKVWLHASHTLFVLYGQMTQVCCNKVGQTGEALPVMPQFKFFSTFFVALKLSHFVYSLKKPVFDCTC
jgi:hypothetical protein